jgi:hypothetical protein
MLPQKGNYDSQASKIELNLLKLFVPTSGWVKSATESRGIEDRGVDRRDIDGQSSIG